ncbi:MAG: MOSC domain-containing protein [Rhodobacteraceae bacterium]|nr:MOSC domain-containing protein [Paracoccaceae bacterium]
MPSVAHIFCHPIKGVGRFALDAVRLFEGRTIRADRVWAVTHEATKFDTAAPAWASCNNFIRGAKAPELQAISITQYVSGSDMVLKHPDHPPFRFNPENEAEHAGFISWLAQFVPENRAQPKALVAAPGRGMTDSRFPSISILNLASLAELSAKAGRPMAPERFRGNFWLDGLDAWEEFNWVGKTLRIGEAHVVIRERIGRCAATNADPLTGLADVDTLGVLESGWNHTDFGVYAEVIKPGMVDIDDGAHIL